MTRTQRGPVIGVAIVKNEEGRIIPTLESYRPFVDRFVICDTGSTDGTQEDVGRWFGATEGQERSELLSIPFGDFSAARNQALRLADDGPAWLLMFDCDSRLEGADPLAFREELRGRSEGALSLLCRTSASDPARFYRRALTRAGVGLDGPGTPGGWHYRYPVHEVLVPPPGQSAPLVESVQIYYEIQDAERRQRRWRDHDIPAILRYLRDVGDDARMRFYLGQTRECLGHFESAASSYRHCVAITQDREERFEAQKRIGDCRYALRDFEAALGAYAAAFGLAPHRAEPLEKIARIFLAKGQIQAAGYFAFAAASLPYPTGDALFVDADLYRSRAKDLSDFIEGILRGAPSNPNLIPGVEP